MLPIDLRGKKAVVTGIGDDQGFGFWIAKALYEAGAEIIAAVWPPILNVFQQSLKLGKFDSSLLCKDGRRLEFSAIYPLDVLYDSMEDVPTEVRQQKRYQDLDSYAIFETSERIFAEKGAIDILIHSIANAPEIQQPLVNTTRRGYLQALSSSSYSFVSLAHHFKEKMNQGSSLLTLSYIASQRVIPGYGGGMSSAKAALESDVRMLAFELGRSHQHRCNAISAGPFSSRAARAIGQIEEMIEWTKKVSPLAESLEAEEVGHLAAFLSSSLASAITGQLIYADKGFSIMGRIS